MEFPRFPGRRSAGATTVRSHTGLAYDTGKLRTAETVSIRQPGGASDCLTIATAQVASSGYTLNAEAVRRRDERSTPPSTPSPGTTTAAPNAACRELLGRAEGLAVTLGDGIPGSSDALMAYLWSGRGDAVIALERLSVSAMRVVAGLTATGAGVPAVPLPEPDRSPWSDRIFVPPDRLSVVVDLLVERLPPGTFGVNTHEGRAWVMAHADIDLQALVDEALSDV